MSGLASSQLVPLRYPTAISTFGQGTIDVYKRGNDDSVYTRLFINGSWQPSTTIFWSLRRQSNFNIAPTSRSLGLTDLFVRGNDYDIYHKTHNGTDPLISTPLRKPSQRHRESLMCSCSGAEERQCGAIGILSEGAGNPLIRGRI
jgi:hypothetical protein